MDKQLPARVLDAGAQAVDDARASVEALPQIGVGRAEDIAARIVLVGGRVGKDLRNVDLARMRKVRVVQADEGKAGGTVERGAVDQRAATDRSVVDPVQRADLAGLPVGVYREGRVHPASLLSRVP